MQSLRVICRLGLRGDVGSNFTFVFSSLVQVSATAEEEAGGQVGQVKGVFSVETIVDVGEDLDAPRQPQAVVQQQELLTWEAAVVEDDDPLPEDHRPGG